MLSSWDYILNVLKQEFKAGIYYFHSCYLKDWFYLHNCSFKPAGYEMWTCDMSQIIWTEYINIFIERNNQFLRNIWQKFHLKRSHSVILQNMWEKILLRWQNFSNTFNIYSVTIYVLMFLVSGHLWCFLFLIMFSGSFVMFQVMFFHLVSLSLCHLVSL